MFNTKEYFSKINKKSEASYLNNLKEIKKINKKIQKTSCKNDELFEYWDLMLATSNRILKMASLEEEIDDTFFKKASMENLKKMHDDFFFEVMPENYDKSYANPAFTVAKLGEKWGQLFCSFYVKYRGYYDHALKHKTFAMDEINSVFIDVYNVLKNKGLNYDDLKEIITRPTKHEKLEYRIAAMRENIDKNFRYYRDIIENDDLTNFRYLYKTGDYISEHILATADFLKSYPEDKLRGLAQLFADAYIRGFEVENKDLSKKSTITILYQPGMEIIYKHLVTILSDKGLESLFVDYYVVPPNRQYAHDHKFDTALVLDKEFVGNKKDLLEKAFLAISSMYKENSGVIIFDSFGETPFKPENKKECMKVSEEQQPLYQEFINNFINIKEKHSPSNETSFSIMAFPSPEIGEDFVEIFREIMDINMLDPLKYQKIQQTMIDVLDKADHVIIKGKGSNRTSLKVKLHEIKNPDKETIFENCGADINIPVGEVYTSPVLAETDGVLHVDENYLDGLKYENLALTFKDGYISDYECSNFPTTEENKKFIEENLLFPHKTLPMGEFAIGTNTLAYMVAQKYGIMSKLPILIIEKMGPHFAIGDTCFSREEDSESFNLFNGKKMIAKDNEKTLIRKSDTSKAYTYRHTDITLPYCSIGSITAVSSNGECVDIIRDERFVLDGTLELNKPLDNI
ncbi:MAG: aminopeptidase [Bacteriovoracaceae bacterium]|nr:aminopeptidase [Bacteriovoracaceae bacterium]